MALITSSEFGKEVPEKAASCPNWGPRLPWIGCAGGLSLALLLAVLGLHAPQYLAIYTTLVLLLAGLSFGIRKNTILALLAVTGMLIGLVSSPVLLEYILCVLILVLVALFAFVVISWRFNPFTSMYIRPGLCYTVQSQECTVPDIDFEGRRPLLLKQSVLDELLALAKYGDQFLARHNIRYVLAYGTLLGAVRHGGLIPWDDDVDFSIVRAEDARRLDEDFEQLAADAARDGYVLFRHSKYWKLAANNFWRYPVLDLYRAVGSLEAENCSRRMVFQDLKLIVPKNPQAVTISRFGNSALRVAVFDLPFWDSGFIPAMMIRLFGARILGVAEVIYHVAYDVRCK